MYFKSVKVCSVFFIFLSTLSCVSIPVVNRYSTIHKNEKSITIPAGGDEFLSALKHEFINNGWEVKTFLKESEITEKSTDREIKYDNFSTNYYLLLNYQCYTKNRTLILTWLNLSLIDIKRKKEVITVYGKTGFQYNAQDAIKLFFKELEAALID